MPAWFYILRLQSGTLYPGATTNLDQRWHDHQAGQACRTTTLDPPTALVFREQFETFSDARRREAQVKRWSAKKKEALVSGDLTSLKRLATSHDTPASNGQAMTELQPTAYDERSAACALQAGTATVTQHSSPDVKIVLFRSLSRPRA